MVARFEGFDVSRKPDGFTVEIRLKTRTIEEALALARDALKTYPIDPVQAQAEEAREEWREAVARSKSTSTEESEDRYAEEERAAIVEESRECEESTKANGGIVPIYQVGGFFEGKKITKTKAVDGIAFLRLEDGTRIKMDLSTLTEIARKEPEPKPAAGDWAESVRAAETLKAAVAVLVEHESEPLAWAVANRESVPVFARVSPKSFRARMERQLETLRGTQ